MTGYVYILTNKQNGTLYTGVTSDIQNRMYEHKNGLTPGFATRYGCEKLVWFERHPNIVLAIAREKALKDYKRDWKIDLIRKLNPNWADLTDKIFEIDNPHVPKPGSRWSENYE